MSADLVGSSSAEVSSVLNLVAASVAGDASVEAPANLEAAAAVTLAGDASVEAPATTLYAVSAGLQGDGVVVAPSQAAYAAEAALEGDGTLVAAALADDETAADLTGGSSFTGAAAEDHAAEVSAVGGAVITAVGMVSPLHKTQKTYADPEPAEVTRMSPKGAGKLTVRLDEAARLGAPEANPEGKIPVVDKDAASEEARRRRPDQERQNPVVPSNEG